MRICLAYDCLYPWTVGGYERWMRALAEGIAAGGHEVTFVTRLQWEPGHAPDIPGVRVVAVSRADPLYGPDGNRLIGPPLRFGRGVLGHLLRHRYDVVHVCSFPYFGLLAARLATRRGLFVDWPEVWTRGYWRSYLGGPAGFVGWAVQRLCARVPQQAFTFSDLHARRLLEEGLHVAPVRLGGMYAGPKDPSPGPLEREPLVVYAGRHIAEKRVSAIPAAIAAARARVPGLRALILGDGPERDAVLEAVEAHGVADIVEVPGFVSSDQVADAIARAACLVLPSVREGYGMVVVEASAVGTPSVVARSADSAAVERIAPGVNGVVAESAAPRDLADALVEAIAGGPGLRASTAAWFAEHAQEISVERAVQRVLAAYDAT